MIAGRLSRFRLISCSFALWPETVLWLRESSGNAWRLWCQCRATVWAQGGAGVECSSLCWVYGSGLWGRRACHRCFYPLIPCWSRSPTIGYFFSSWSLCWGHSICLVVYFSNSHAPPSSVDSVGQAVQSSHCWCCVRALSRAHQGCCLYLDSWG